MKDILCSISTRGRYDTTLAMSIQSVIQQTKKIDKLMIYDDNEEKDRIDLRGKQHFAYLFKMMDEMGIEWGVIFGQRKGQHYNHQLANKEGYKYVWRVDDDVIAEPNVLEVLYKNMRPDVGAVGGSILTPPLWKDDGTSSSKINELHKQNKQWFYIKKTEEVDHLHCSFLYRAGIEDYELGLSRVAHREETLFTYGLKKKGYKILIAPCISWHLRNSSGGIRDGVEQLFNHDERIFQNKLQEWGVNCKPIKPFVLDNGIGDHIVFKSLLPKIKEKFKNHNLVFYVCYPEVFDGDGLVLRSIGDAQLDFGSLERFNLYSFGDKKNYKNELVEAYKEIYGI